jgi:hypothetical protein
MARTGRPEPRQVDRAPASLRLGEPTATTGAGVLLPGSTVPLHPPAGHNDGNDGGGGTPAGLGWCPCTDGSHGGWSSPGRGPLNRGSFRRERIHAAHSRSTALMSGDRAQPATPSEIGTTNRRSAGTFRPSPTPQLPSLPRSAERDRGGGTPRRPGDPLPSLPRSAERDRAEGHTTAEPGDRPPSLPRLPQPDDARASAAPQQAAPSRSLPQFPGPTTCRHQAGHRGPIPPRSLR